MNDNKIKPIKAPFPYFGGKSRAAHLIWDRLGKVSNYVEPFAGSLAVLWNCPYPITQGIVNDKYCFIANVWRAIKEAPEDVAKWADNPVNEADLHARHRWLHQQHEFMHRMEHQPDYFDARIAGWWIWGMSCWIGDNFCRPSIQESLPHLSGGKGVARQIPHLSRGMGEAQRMTVAIKEWFVELSNRLRHVKVCCGDWRRVLTKSATYGIGTTGIVLDPPYEADGIDDVYGKLSRGVAPDVRQWAIENGGNSQLRIALCGYGDEGHVELLDHGWTEVAWKASGGYNNQGHGKNAIRERIYFSPHCLSSQKSLFDILNEPAA